MTDTIMNTGAASLSDEQRTTIQHAADKLRTVWANHTGDKESRELCHKLEAILATLTPQADADFKNFHRLLCERFDYVHDEGDWKRDQLSLIEHIASRAAIAAGGAQEAVATVTKTGRVVDFDVQIGAFNLADGKHSLYAAPLPREAATVPATDEQKELEVALAKVDPRPYCPAAYTEHVWFKRGWKFRALLAASGDQS
jgi:hypothetical protein